MRTNVFLLLVAAGMVLAGPAIAADQMPWAADLRSACSLAADQHRLVLLHFYSDNCSPCLRLEQNVFSQTTVAEAVAKNYVPVKIHAAKQPQLVTRYRINHWPVDVIVTPSGLEIFRTDSPQKPAEYIAFINHIAQQTGIGAARNWAGKLSQTADPLMQRTIVASHQVEATIDQAQQSAMATGQNTAAAAQHAIEATEQRATTGAQQLATVANQAAEAVDQGLLAARNAAEGSRGQVVSTFDQIRNQTQETVGQVEREAVAEKQRLNDAAEASANKVNDAAKEVADGWRQAAGQVASARRSLLPQVDSALVMPPREAAPANPSAAAPAARGAQNARAQYSAPPVPPVAQLPTENPWFTMQRTPAQAIPTQPPADALPTAAPPVPHAPAPPPAVTQPAASQPQAEQPQVAAATSSPALAEVAATHIAPPTSLEQVASQILAPRSASSAPPSSAPHLSSSATIASTPTAPYIRPEQPSHSPGSNELVPASQAPPIALDGFCPVTLIETMANNPTDRGAWRKGDLRCGAIHRGRTYLFASATEQQKFLAHPDTFAPVMSGFDVVRYAERGELVEGRRSFGLVTPEGRIYLFADEESLIKFNRSPANYAAAAELALRGN